MQETTLEQTTSEAEILRQAAVIMGRKKTPAKQAAARENGKAGGRPKGTGRPMSEETRAKMKAAQAARREREQAPQEETGATTE